MDNQDNNIEVIYSKSIGKKPEPVPELKREPMPEPVIEVKDSAKVEQELGLPPLYQPKVKKNRALWIFPSRKPYVLAKIILDNRQIIRIKANIEATGIIKCGSKAYNVLPKAIYHERLRFWYIPVSYYYWNNPNPLVFDSVSRVQLINPETFKDALDTKVVNDVLKPQMSAILFIILMAVIAVGIVALYIAYKLSKTGAA